MKEYATKNQENAKRKFKEDFSITKNSFAEDRMRLVSSSAFRRMEYKTQVFVNHAGDHYRNRLTHSIEVASIAKIMAANLEVNENLAEVIALAHDIGHTPFGHVGEDALNEKMKNFGGFSHNTNSFKILTQLEKRYAGFNGLNLTWESLEGVAKHNGPITVKTPQNSYIFQYDAEFNLDLSNFSSLEAQIAAIADDIAYSAHDIEDGIRAGFFKLDDLKFIPMVENLIEEIDNQHHDLEKARRVYEFKRHLLRKLIENVTLNTEEKICHHAIENADSVRNAKICLVEFSEEIFAEIKKIKAFLLEKMYYNDAIKNSRKISAEIVSALFDFFVNDIREMPEQWQNECKNASKEEIPTIVADYVAGMTDRYAIQEFERISS